MPIARPVERDIVLLAEQDCEAGSLVGAHGLDCGVESEGGIAAAATVLARHDPADTADMDLLAIPVDGAEIDADVTGQSRFGCVDEHAQIRMRPFDVAPRQFLDDFLPEHRFMQRLGPPPRGVTIENVDFDAHRGACCCFWGLPIFSNLRCLSALEPSIRGSVKSRLPQFWTSAHDLYASPPALRPRRPRASHVEGNAGIPPRQASPGLRHQWQQRDQG